MSKTNAAKNQYIKQINEKNVFIGRLSDLLLFSFKYYQHYDGGQSFEEWESAKILADLNNKIHDFSGKTKNELLNDRTLELYDSYPKGSKFTKPKALAETNITWARLRLTGGRRLAGFFVNDALLDKADKKDIFYIVFLDRNHEFAPSTKK